MITTFQGKYRFLSNFWPATVVLDGEVYPSVEHAYQAAKTLNREQREFVRNCKTPGEAKRASRSLNIRKDWEEVKLEVMRKLLSQKFALPKLRALLLATGTQELIEGNTWGDTFWGICQGAGKNNLGKLLMEIRDEYLQPHQSKATAQS